jgi:hypothetical protein
MIACVLLLVRRSQPEKVGAASAWARWAALAVEGDELARRASVSPKLDYSRVCSSATRGPRNPLANPLRSLFWALRKLTVFALFLRRRLRRRRFISI